MCTCMHAWKCKTCTRAGTLTCVHTWMYGIYVFNKSIFGASFDFQYLDELEATFESGLGYETREQVCSSAENKEKNLGPQSL
jgi:hypothetical protein